MPVFLDIKSRLDVRLAEAAAREATDLFRKAGDDINRGLSGSISKALGSFDSTASRRELQALQAEHARTARAEEDAAQRMTRSYANVEIAQRKILDLTGGVADAATLSSTKMAKAERDLADAHAVANRAARDHADAMVATEAGHQRLATATDNSSAATSRAGQVWNGVGVASLAAFGGAMVETTRKAGDFQASQERLVASAGETSANLKTVSDGILQMAGQVGYSAQDLSNGMYTVEKAGYRAGDGVTVLKSAAQLAKAENADLGEVLNGLTTSMNDFGYSSDRSAEVASKMNTAVGLAKTNLQDFSNALHSVEPIAAAAHIQLEDVYGSLAQITQSGTSPDQGAQNMAHSITTLIKPTQQMREEMGQFGVDARDIQQHLGDRGYAGTVQHLSDVIRQHMNPAGQVVIDTMFKSQQATDSAKTIFDALPPAAQKVAKAIQDGSLSYKDFRKSRGGLDQEQANELQQWVNLNNKVSGYSNALKTGQGDIQTYEQALALMTGGQDTLKTVLQLVGENAGATNDKIKEIKDSTTAADGSVKGFNETQTTLNAKMADAKAAFGAAATEMGSAFVPVMTDVANVAKTVGDAMAQHPRIAHDVIDALGLMGGAWLLIKGYNIASTILAPIASGLGTLIEKATLANTTMAGAGAAAESGMAGVATATTAEIAEEDALATSAATADAAVAGGGAAGGAGKFASALKAVPYIGTAIALQEVSSQVNPDNNPSNRAQKGWGETIFGDAWNWFGGGHAGGGPISGSGPKGRDSVPMWGAPGEHVLTAADVDAMGGHSSVYAFRGALHRAGGGEIGPDVQAAYSMIGTGYSQASRNDCSGMVGRVISSALGINAGLPTTQNMGQWLAALGFQPGSGGPGSISVGWYNHGSAPNDGHTAMTLSDGENAESGGSHGNFLVGGGAAGANSSQFDHHMFLPNLYGEGPGSGGGGSFGGSGGGGGIPAGATAGTGPHGQSGYYMPDAASDKKAGAAQTRIDKLQADIKVLEEKKSEETAKTKQSEKDRLDNEIKNKNDELTKARQSLDDAEKGSFHASSRSGRGSGGSGMGGMQFGAPLPANMGLGKGIPGFFEWLATFAADMAIGPIEGAMLGDAIRSGDMGAGSMPDTGGGASGGFADLGNQGTPLPTSLAASFSPPAGGGSPGGDTGASSASGGGGGGSGPSATGGGGGKSSWYPGGWKSGAPANTNPALNNPPAPGAPGGPGGPPPVAPYMAPGPMFGPASPDQGLSTDTLARLHGADGNLATPAHVPPPDAPINLGPPLPSVDQLKQRFGNQVPLFPQAPQSSNYAKQWYQPPGQRFAQGGPSGNDTIPAWLSPGEFVMNENATKNNLSALQFMNAGHYDVGSLNPLTPPKPPPQPSQPAPKPAQPGQGKPAQQGKPPEKPKPPEGQQHLPPGGPQLPGPGNLPPPPPGSETHPGLQTPGASTQQFGEGLPPSGGIGFGGGIIGAAEGAASAAGNMAAPGAGAGIGAAMQLMNRTAGYIGQLGGIAAEGILSTFLPADSALSNFSNTLPGKLIAGIAGVRPGTPNSAGKTEAPLKPEGDKGGGGKGGGDTHIGTQFQAPITVKADNPDQFHSEMARQYSAAQAAYPMKTP